jgi:hypothetical protein
MQTRRPQLTPAVAITAVLVLALAMLVSRGLAEALVMIAVVAVLAGMYLLRRYARAELVYRHHRDPSDRDGGSTPPPPPDAADHRQGAPEFTDHRG